VVKADLGAEGLGLSPSFLFEKRMLKLRELSQKLMSNEMSVVNYKLHLIATLTTLSGNELRALARLIVDHNA
jgi:hypothetical protein